MSKLISVIVPIYNIERYVPRCIESILQQSYKNLEIILIDDASTDNSRKICKNYAGKDSRIKLIQIERNQGISVTRNVGLDSVSGRNDI